MSVQDDYWIECVSIAAEECGAILTHDQIVSIAAGVQGGHENYGMAFYSPPASDRISVIENEWKAKLKALEAQHEAELNSARRVIAARYPRVEARHISFDKEGVYYTNGRTQEIVR